MLVEKTQIPGVRILTFPIFSDGRGSVQPLVHGDLAGSGVSESFEQFNITTNVRGATRGMHWQPGQSKLCTVISGEAWDVVLDVRVGSPTFGKSIKFLLSNEYGKALYIPDGCAHGFQALDNGATVLYFMSTRWNETDQLGVSMNDSRIDFRWPIPLDKAIISSKDALYPRLGIVNPEYLPDYVNGSR